MATIVATRHSRLIRSYYWPLLRRGKATMTALVGCMRTFLMILSAMIKNQSPWKETVAN